MDGRTAERRAISRAVALGVAGEVQRVRLGWYRVPSTTQPGTVYTVRVVDGRYTCDCPAGRSGRPCVHAAGVFIRKVEANANGARVTGPAAPPPAAAPPAPTNVVPFARRAA